MREKTMRNTIRITKEKKGKLAIVGVPIGNFEDLSPRAQEMLKQCKLILCEDTRSSALFLQHFGITPDTVSSNIISYVGSYEKAIAFAQRAMDAGDTVCLICDRGMIGVSDPGAKVVAHFRNLARYEITCVPGPSAAITAFALSGYFGSFIFHGFLPRKKNEMIQLINTLKDLDYNLIFFESALRMHATLDTLANVLDSREIMIARELTKPFENVMFGTALQLMQQEFKGECVIVVKKN